MGSQGPKILQKTVEHWEKATNKNIKDWLNMAKKLTETSKERATKQARRQKPQKRNSSQGTATWCPKHIRETFIIEDHHANHAMVARRSLVTQFSFLWPERTTTVRVLRLATRRRLMKHSSIKIDFNNMEKRWQWSSRFCYWMVY